MKVEIRDFIGDPARGRLLATWTLDEQGCAVCDAAAFHAAGQLLGVQHPSGYVYHPQDGECFLRLLPWVYCTRAARAVVVAAGLPQAWPPPYMQVIIEDHSAGGESSGRMTTIWCLDEMGVARCDNPPVQVMAGRFGLKAGKTQVYPHQGRLFLERLVRQHLRCASVRVRLVESHAPLPPPRSWRPWRPPPLCLELQRYDRATAGWQQRLVWTLDASGQAVCDCPGMQAFSDRHGVRDKRDGQRYYPRDGEVFLRVLLREYGTFELYRARLLEALGTHVVVRSHHESTWGRVVARWWLDERGQAVCDDDFEMQACERHGIEAGTDRLFPHHGEAFLRALPGHYAEIHCMSARVMNVEPETGWADGTQTVRLTNRPDQPDKDEASRERAPTTGWRELHGATCPAFG